MQQQHRRALAALVIGHLAAEHVDGLFCQRLFCHCGLPVSDRTIWACLSGTRGPGGSSSVCCHEDRKPKTGEMMQRLIDTDQGPEPGMLLFQRNTKTRCTNT